MTRQRGTQLQNLTSSRSAAGKYVKYQSDASKERGYVDKRQHVGHKPTAVPYRVYERRYYDVEIIFKPNGDVDYHFFPQKGRFDFPFAYKIMGMVLEDAAVWAVGTRTKSEADYYDREIAKWFSRAGEDPNRSLGQPTFFVRFQKVGDKLGAEKMLVDKFLGRIDHLMDIISTESLRGKPQSVLYREWKQNRQR